MVCNNKKYKINNICLKELKFLFGFSRNDDVVFLFVLLLLFIYWGYIIFIVWFFGLLVLNLYVYLEKEFFMFMVIIIR